MDQKPSYEELEKRLQELENADSFRTLFEYAYDPIFILDPDSYRILDCNQKAIKLLEYSYEELTSMTGPDLHPGHEVKNIPELIKPFIKGGDVINFTGIHFQNKGGVEFPVEINSSTINLQGKTVNFAIVRDITERKRAEAEREKLIRELQNALSEVKTLQGFLPICASCKKIRDDKGYWEQIENYLHKHSEVEFSHSICPECAEKLYPDFK